MRQNSGLKPFQVDTDALDGIIVQPQKSPPSQEKASAATNIPFPAAELSVSSAAAPNPTPKPQPRIPTPPPVKQIFPPKESISQPPLQATMQPSYSPAVTTIYEQLSPELASNHLPGIAPIPRPKRRSQYLRQAILLFGLVTSLFFFWRMTQEPSPATHPVSGATKTSSKTPNHRAKNEAPADLQEKDEESSKDNGPVPPSDNSGTPANTRAIIYNGALVSIPLDSVPSAAQTNLVQNHILKLVKEISQTRGNILIIGHASPSPEGPKHDLGLQRAQFVQQLLLKEQVSAKRIQVASRAMIGPHAPNFPGSNDDKIEFHIDPVELLETFPSTEWSNSFSGLETASAIDFLTTANRFMTPLPLTFRTGRWETDTGIEKIRAIAAEIKSNNKRIVLVGHTDTRGSRRLNLIIGLWRAEFVRKLLLKEGVAPERIIIASRGSSLPKTEEITEEDLNANRRVEIRLF